jgi:hypothetical protein
VAAVLAAFYFVGAVYGLSVGVRGFLLFARFFHKCEWEHEWELSESDEDEDDGVGVATATICGVVKLKLIHN